MPLEGDTPVSARDRLFDDIWDMRSATEKNALIDAHRDEVALEIGRDVLRDGLVPTLARLIGEANATKLLADFRNASTGDEERTKANARDEVVNGLVEHACCFSMEDATRMVDAFAHELAEQQRAWAAAENSKPGGLDDSYDNGVVDGASQVADLIDPLKGKP